ncbi:MAG TPA: hypothetical protein VJB35_06365 [Candidatus Nanoarchaeia archaeon]|nr:hypothetical protein [Candidatus Nanoarchaeia archaeon]
MVLSIFIYIIIFIAIIVGIVLFILHRIEKDLKEKMLQAKNDPNKIYLQKIGRLKGDNPQKVLEEINQITKDFFKDAFKVRLFRGYNKIIESLSQEKNKPEINYCNLLNHALYSGEAPNKKTNEVLIRFFRLIILNNKIIAKVQKKDVFLEFLKKVNIFRLH